MNSFPFLLGTPWLWWPIVLAGAGACWLTWRGYARRTTEIDSSRLKLLNILRMSGWALLFVCLLQPMRREYVREEKASRLTVLIDDSESMSFSDKHNAPSRSELVKTILVGKANPASTKNTSEPLGKDALLSVLSRNFKLQLEAFESATRTLGSGENSDMAKALKELKAQGEITDVAKALNDSFFRLKGPDAGGLVLISDGADTAHGDLERAANLYKRAGIPIYALGVGETDLQDLSISQVRCRRTVSKDTLVHVEVDVRKCNLPAGIHNVTLSRNGRRVGESCKLIFKDAPSKSSIESNAPENSDSATAVFEFLPDGQGFLEYEALVEPFPGELVTVNNSMAFGLVAFSRKLRVLYMEGSMFQHQTYRSESSGTYFNHPMQNWWEHEFLARALTEDSDVDVDVLAKHEVVSLHGGERPSIETVKARYPKTKKELYQYDVIISSDIPYSHFSDDQIQWTVDFVGKHGGGFVMIGGYDAFGEGKYAKTSIDRMLPVEMNASDDHEDDVNFNWQLTDEAWSHPIMQIEKDGELNHTAWRERLPRFHGFSRTTRPKPAATTLAVVADEQFDTAYGPSILLAVQPFGNGRSMALTTDTTGSWGTEWEDSWGSAAEQNDLSNRNRYYKTFWKNAVRWLAHYRMQAPNQLVQLESDRLVYGRGESPVIRLRVMNEDYELTHEAKVQLTIAGPGGGTEQVAVYPRYEEPGIYERKLELGTIGRYEIEAVAILGKEELGRDKAIFQVRPSTAESRQLSQNADLLKRLASQTGGMYLPIEKASELPQFLREAGHVIEKHRDNDLWDRPWMFILIIGLLCSEWFFRKRSGLP